MTKAVGRRYLGKVDPEEAGGLAWTVRSNLSFRGFMSFSAAIGHALAGASARLQSGTLRKGRKEGRKEGRVTLTALTSVSQFMGCRSRSRFACVHLRSYGQDRGRRLDFCRLSLQKARLKTHSATSPKAGDPSELCPTAWKPRSF